MIYREKTSKNPDGRLEGAEFACLVEGEGVGYPGAGAGVVGGEGAAHEVHGVEGVGDGVADSVGCVGGGGGEVFAAVGEGVVFVGAHCVAFWCSR